MNLYERRELTRNVHVDARFLQRNILASLVAQLRHKYEGICLPEGYVQPRSITVVEHSFGRTNILKGGLDYSVRFQADLCLPHAGQVFKAPVVLKSKIGLNTKKNKINQGMIILKMIKKVVMILNCSNLPKRLLK